MLSNGKIKKLADRGVRIARKENFVYGLPNVMSKDGKIYYELPSGEIKEEFNWDIYNKSLLVYNFLFPDFANIHPFF